MKSTAPRRRRAWLTVLPVLALFLVILGSWAVIFFSDGAPPDDADLRPRPTPLVADADNSYFLWESAMKRYVPGDAAEQWRWLPRSDSLLNPIKTRDAKDDQQNEAWYQEHARDCLHPLAAALRAEAFFPPKSTAFPNDILRCFSVLDRAAFATMARDDWEGAWEWTEVSKEWRQRFLTHPVDAVSVMLATGSPTTDTRLEFALAMPEDLELLRKCLATTEDSEFSLEWRESRLRRQYEFLFLRFETGEYFTQSRTVPPPSWAVKLYRPHRTQRRLAAWTRLALRECAAGRNPEAALAPERESRSRGKLYLDMATGNAGGEWLLRKSFVLPDEVVGVRYLREKKLTEAITRTVLALRIYYAQHGAPPETLDALVPEILPALPIDPNDLLERPRVLLLLPWVAKITTPAGDGDSDREQR